MEKTPKTKEIAIEGEYITLGQLLKFADVVSQGGEVKSYLAANTVLVNGEEEARRGRKIRPGDKVSLKGAELHIVSR